MWVVGAVGEGLPWLCVGDWCCRGGTALVVGAIGPNAVGVIVLLYIYQFELVRIFMV